MIPYIPPPVFHLGGIDVRAFGVAACLAILVGHSLALRYAESWGLDPGRLSWIYAGGAALAAVTGHLWYAAANQSYGSLFQIWRGQSSSGFIVGALLTILFVLSRWGREGWRYLDGLAFAFPFAWTLVRIGCFLAHDHIGARTSSPLGVQFPGGGRFDLGLLEAIMAAAACSLVYISSRRFKLPGQLFGLMVLLAGIGRLLVSAASGNRS
jgi:phosphatidylglycerol---prolipoprotein diacylglyceryl transferase